MGKAQGGDKETEVISVGTTSEIAIVT